MFMSSIVSSGLFKIFNTVTDLHRGVVCLSRSRMSVWSPGQWSGSSPCSGQGCCGFFRSSSAGRGRICSSGPGSCSLTGTWDPDGVTQRQVVLRQKGGLREDRNLWWQSRTHSSLVQKGHCLEAHFSSRVLCSTGRAPLGSTTVPCWSQTIQFKQTWNIQPNTSTVFLLNVYLCLGTWNMLKHLLYLKSTVKLQVIQILVWISYCAVLCYSLYL